MPRDELPGWKLLKPMLWKDGESFQGLCCTQRSVDKEEMVTVFIRQQQQAHSACINAVRIASYGRYVKVTDVMNEAELEKLIRLFKDLPGTSQDVEIRLL